MGNGCVSEDLKRVFPRDYVKEEKPKQRTPKEIFIQTLKSLNQTYREFCSKKLKSQGGWVKNEKLSQRNPGLLLFFQIEKPQEQNFDDIQESNKENLIKFLMIIHLKSKKPINFLHNLLRKGIFMNKKHSRSRILEKIEEENYLIHILNINYPTIGELGLKNQGFRLLIAEHKREGGNVHFYPVCSVDRTEKEDNQDYDLQVSENSGFIFIKVSVGYMFLCKLELEVSEKKKISKKEKSDFVSKFSDGFRIFKMKCEKE